MLRILSAAFQYTFMHTTTLYVFFALMDTIYPNCCFEIKFCLLMPQCFKKKLPIKETSQKLALKNSEIPLQCPGI